MRRGYAFAAQVGLGGSCRREQPVRDAVGEDAVHLLGHREVEGTQPGLDVRDRDVQLGRRQRARERRVGVAIQQHRSRPFGNQHCSTAASCGPSSRREGHHRYQGASPDAGCRVRGRTRPTYRRRSAGRCAGCARRSPRSPAAPRKPGAALMNCGRAPRMVMIFIVGDAASRGSSRSQRKKACRGSSAQG